MCMYERSINWTLGKTETINIGCSFSEMTNVGESDLALAIALCLWLSH